MHVALVLTLALVLVQDATQAEPVRPGYVGVGTIGEGEEVRLALAIDAPGAITLSLESFEFDPVVGVVDGQDRTLARDEDTGTGSGAWLSLDVQPFVTYEIVVASEDGGGGHYLLEVRDGRQEPPQEREAEGLVRLYSQFAEHERSGDDPRTAAILYYRIGEAMYGRAEYVLAAPPLREALALAQQTGHAVIEAAAGAYLGACERRIGDHERGLELLEAAWERRAAVGNPGFDCVILENLGEARFDRREPEAALARFDEYLATAEAAGLEMFAVVAHSRRGKALDAMGDHEAAGAAFARALGMLGSVEDPYLRSLILLDAGRFMIGGDRYAEAAGVLERAADLPTTWEVQLEIQVAQGSAQTALGRYGAARRCLERAESLLGDRRDRRFELPLQVAMAELAFRTGDEVRSRALTEDAIAAARARDDLPLVVELTAWLGMLRERAEDFEAAERAYRDALDLCAGLDRPELEWRVLFDQGRLCRKRERYEQALELERRALALTGRLDAPSTRAACLNAIAFTLTFLGTSDLDEARRHAEEALALWEAVGETDQVLTGPLHTLAVVALGQGRLDEAEGLLARAADLIDRDDVTGLRRMEAAGVRSGFAVWGEVAQDLVARRLAEPDADRAGLVARGFRDAGRWKARALFESLPEHATGEDALGTLRESLGEDRALIEYARGARSLYAYVLRADDLLFLDLGDASDLDAQVAGFLDGMTVLDRLALPAEIAARGSALHARLLAPVLAVIDERVQALVVVPTAGLARLPFEALVDGTDGADGAALGFDRIRFVADRYDVTYAPSTPVLARLEELGPRRTPGRALVMGDPWYGAETTAGATARDPRTTGPARYDRLLATRAEVVDIAEALLLAEPEQDEGVKLDLAELAALKRERSGRLRSRRFDLYVGQEVSAERLRSDLREYEVLHIAAHGEVDPDDPLRTGLVLSYDGTAHDQLTLLDIRELELDANLVVLSACETASGHILEGEGVQSMANAFLQAGSRAVVASLWSVDDSATRETMAHFYESILLDDRSGDEALRDAKVLRQLKQSVRHHGVSRGPAPGDPLRPLPPSQVGHPYYWAPFIYIGALPRR